MTEDEAGALGWMIRTVDWSESKCGEINPKGRYTGLVRDPSEQRAHNRGGVQEGHPWIHGRGIKTAGFSHKGCNLPSTDIPNFSTDSRNVAGIWCDDCYQPRASASMTLSVCTVWDGGWQVGGWDDGRQVGGRPPETTPVGQPAMAVHHTHSSSFHSSSLIIIWIITIMMNIIDM